MRLGWKLPLERLSASSMGLMIQCPEQFRQKYLVKEVKDTMTSARFIGIVDHKVSENLIRAIMVEHRDAGDLITPEFVEALYSRTWNEVIDDQGEPDWRDDNPAKMIDRGVKMAELYAREVLPKINPVAAEERFEFKIPGVPSKIIGYLDIIERDKIRERKTTGVKTTKPKPKWRFQGILYQYAAGLPVQWDVITRQATPQLFTADIRDEFGLSAYPDLHLPMLPMKVAETLIRDTAIRMNDLYARYGADNPWPMEGMFTSDWLCDYCPIGPKYERTCLAWHQ